MNFLMAKRIEAKKGGFKMSRGTIRAATLKTIVEFISGHFSVNDDKALDMFYTSHTGACYSDDSTGLYGQSALYVFSLFLEEKEK